MKAALINRQGAPGFPRLLSDLYPQGKHSACLLRSMFWKEGWEDRRLGGQCARAGGGGTQASVGRAPPLSCLLCIPSLGDQCLLSQDRLTRWQYRAGDASPKTVLLLLLLLFHEWGNSFKLGLNGKSLWPQSGAYFTCPDASGTAHWSGAGSPACLRALSQSNHSLYWKENEELGKDYFYWVYYRETNKTWQVPGLLTVSLQSHI